MPLRIPNPITAIGNMLNRMVDQEMNSAFERDDDPGLSGARAPVPTSPGPQAPSTGAQANHNAQEGETTIVTGRFVPDGATNANTQQLALASAHETARFRRIVERFDEDRQEPIEWVIRKLAALFCYLAPFILAVPIGLAVGDAFTPANASWVMGLAVHMLSIALEIIMPILGLATTISLKRAVKDRSKMSGAVVVALFFTGVSIGNALALLFLLEKGGITLDFANNAAGSVGILLRSFGSFLVDTGCTVYLSVSGVRSLAKYLADERAKIAAIRDVNQVNIELDQATTRAAMERQSAIMDMQSKQQRQTTWNEIERMQSQAMIDQTRRNMLDSGSRDRGGYSRRGYYSNRGDDQPQLPQQD